MRIPRKSPTAFSLVEVALALGVAAFALIAVFGLLPVGLNSNQACIRETQATGILTNIISDLRTTATSGTAAGAAPGTSPRLRIGVATAGSATSYMDGGGGPYPASGVIASTSQYRVTVTTVLPPTSSLPAGVSSARGATQVKIVASWPAAAALARASGSVSAYVALDRN